MSKDKEVHGLDKLTDDILLKQCRFELGIKESEIAELKYKIGQLKQKVNNQSQTIKQLRKNADKHSEKLIEKNELVNQYVSGKRDDIIRENFYAQIIRTSDKNKKLVKEAKRKIEAFMGRYMSVVNELEKFKSKYGEL